MSDSWLDEIPARIAALDEAHLRRRRHATAPLQGAASGAHMAVDGRPMLAFCSNDYLGLASHPTLVRAACAGAQAFGVGSGGSPLVSGHSTANAALEEQLARFVQLPRALYFIAEGEAEVWLWVPPRAAGDGGAGGGLPEAARGTAEWIVTALCDGILGIALGFALIPLGTKVIGPIWGRVFGGGETAAH